MVAITPDSPIAAVFGRSVKKRQTVEEGLGLTTVGDLLWHFPRRYVRTTELSDVDTLVEGELMTVVGEVTSSKVSTFTNRRTMKPGSRVEVRVATQGPAFVMTWFLPHQTMAERERARMAVGTRGMFTGKAQVFNGQWQLAQPHAVIFGGGDGTGDGSDEHLAASLKGLMPIYPLTAKLYSWDLQKTIQFALDVVTGVEDVFPEHLLDRFDLPDVMTALRWIHGPDDYDEVRAAQKRFRFTEALVLQLVLARRRAALRAQGAQGRTGGQRELLAAFDARLPFELTAGQREVGEVIEAELAQPHPMNRLLQGEVGSGKTLVALRAMLRVVDSGGQAVLLAPTEVLAQQHHRSITAMLGDLAGGGMLGGADDATRVTLLTGSMGKAQRQSAMLEIATGDAGIVVGTHALLEGNVSFFDLGLVVVDEQHRFGVEQRAALTDKAATPPHVLVMTATPIPRTVAMTVFGDLETSVLRELPAGRAPIASHVAPLTEQPHWEQRVWERVAEEVAKGHQVYVVCPRIAGDELEAGESDAPREDDEAPRRPLRAVEEVTAMLTGGPLSHVRVEALHGRLAPEVKEQVMRRFAAGEVDVLVSTTVIEVGVDVANATMMVILDADRFGVSQLHQLRGRVGRGGLPGLCLLVSHAESGSDARDRLEAVAATTDGFELSRVDLEQRREGDVLGKNQSGFRSSLVNLRVLRDEKTIVAAREAAEALLDEDPDLAGAPALGRLVAEIEDSARSDYMEKA
ncbi:ATP-dependent DNA helicase RecG [Nocardioides daphniae]|uniref:ATP-dependent DNA helicase RecG n=1 Tax=Nocardioides daphniae TaxID=402297 RepID=A0A4P7U9U2_9ACTN|nr:ATP-dependent DNA helicase RecG [Nocardioides daphniae]QCC76893.1 ATP-dependent DNA helicase RecG [Nocardioides daphniae]GGD17480.1 ATP-dependent DNA helicase RecG [Nocardioides daphniae]